MAHKPGRVRSRVRLRASAVKHLLKALLPLLLAPALAHTVFAAGPDTSAQSFIKLDHRRNTYIAGELGWMEYAQPTAAAASVWALVGNSILSYEADILAACCTDFDYTINPVIVTGPFNGNPYDTLNLYPPPLEDPEDVEKFGASLGHTRVSYQRWGLQEVLSETSSSPFGPFWLTAGGGRVHLYLHNGTTFVHDHTVVYGGLEERFGHAVDLRLNALLVGSPRGDAGSGRPVRAPDRRSHRHVYLAGKRRPVRRNSRFAGRSGAGRRRRFRHGLRIPPRRRRQLD
ncbi:MAG: hypothetical protein U5K56_18310 [Halioglobus sp.]|nr:hypothetical protein [Halioglobus sp.]